MKLLIFERQPNRAEAFATLLNRENFEVQIVREEQSITEAGCDLLIMYTVADDLSCFDIAHHLRKAGIALPILLISDSGDVNARIYAWERGADYFLTNPSVRELLACIHASMRIHGIRNNALVYGNTRLDLSANILGASEAALSLSPKEYALMKVLLHHKNAIVPKESLIVSAWGYDSHATDNYVEVYISRLRKKLAMIHSNLIIRAVPHLGYRLECQTDKPTSSQLHPLQ